MGNQVDYGELSLDTYPEINIDVDIEAWKSLQRKSSHAVTELDSEELLGLYRSNLLFFSRSKNGQVTGSFYKRPLNSGSLFRWGGC